MLVQAVRDEDLRVRRAEVALIGDAKPILRRLIDALPAHNGKRPSRREEMIERQGKMRARLAKLAPQIGYLEAIRAELGEDGILVDEVTQSEAEYTTMAFRAAPGALVIGSTTGTLVRRLNASGDTIRTGRRPFCSWPSVGSGSMRR